ncbi:MAG: peptidoglycan-binding protein [Saprospiraceae bacterium]|nr:peptidoglycan-binding protein [Bacteroidia bacterium]NNE16149.1 peptidoglycan-binding protein [Saprospiraceae bacterium]NNL92373.1 peptidoglycan-binding protein [Saprospiraceae bacterium]
MALRTNSLVLLILFFCVFTSCGSYYQNNVRNSSEAGMPKGQGCLAKCIIPEKYEINSINILEYTGDDYSNQNVNLIDIEISPASKRWEKKLADKNCKSENPDDCLVWCLVEEDAITQSYYVVIDTIIEKSFKKTTVVQKIITQEAGLTEWRQVVCAKDLNPRFYKKIQSKLLELGYKIGPKGVTGEFDAKSKAALTSFQKENQLPQGNIDFQTLDALGVEY